ncbi:hypothetical protein [Streptomyces mirabilis]|uniref:hypothetical protein n=1 Tax=Streptomyces mirabilis TaxID=68239 RepID=UPI0036A0B366
MSRPPAVLGLNRVLILIGISPRPITLSEGLTFNYLGKQVRGHYGGSPESVTELVRLAEVGRLDLAPPSRTTSRSPRPSTRSTGWRKDR